MAVVESLIVGKDKEVRGENVRVITTGKAVHLSRPVQKLFLSRLELGHPRSRMSPKNALQGHKGAMFLAVQQRWMRSGRPVRNQPND